MKNATIAIEKNSFTVVFNGERSNETDTCENWMDAKNQAELRLVGNNSKERVIEVYHFNENHEIVIDWKINA